MHSTTLTRELEGQDVKYRTPGTPAVAFAQPIPILSPNDAAIFPCPAPMKKGGPFTRPSAASPVHDAVAPRLLAYCASNVGVGPLMRLTRVLEEIKKRRPEISLLLATDAVETGPAEEAGAAVLRLPKFEFEEGREFKERPQHLRLRNHELAALRAAVLLAAGRYFAPDMLLADTNPHGKHDELLPLLRYMRRNKVAAALLMRDIPAARDEAFKLRGTGSMVLRQARYYAALLVAGDANFFDVAREYEWPEELRRKLIYTRFVLPARASKTREEVLGVWPGLSAERSLVVGSCGGGWQSEEFVPVLLEGMRLVHQASGAYPQLLIFAGPAVDAERLRQWRRTAAGLRGVVVETFSLSLADVLGHADLVLTQAGSTAFQILESKVPIVLLRRPFKTSEQAERAERLGQFPGIRCEDVAAISPEAVAGWIKWGLAQRLEVRRTGYRFDGAPRGADEVIKLLEGGTST